MKRVALIGTIIGGLVLSTGAHASGQMSSRPSLSRLASQVRTSLGGVRPLASAGAPAGQTAQQLRIPPSAFSPATQISSDGVADNASANSTLIRLIIHSQGYEVLGRATGYYESATWLPAGAPYPTYLYYLGSIYGSEANAQAAFQDASTTPAVYPNEKTQDCSTADTRCTLGALQEAATFQVFNIPPSTPGAPVDAHAYDFFITLQYHQCTVEGLVRMGSVIWNSTNASDQMSTTISNIADAGDSAMHAACGSNAPLPTTPPISTPTPQPTTPPSPTPTPTQVSTQYSLLGVGVAKHGASKLGKSFKRGTKLDLVIGFDVTSAPANASVKLAFLVLLGKKKVLSKTESGTLNQTGQDVEGITHTFKKVGTYTFAAGVSINGGALQAAKTTFKITK